MSTYPKSPKDAVAGMVWFPRMLDKIRLHGSGQLPADYHENLGQGMDKRCCAFLRVDYPALRERTLAGGTDEEILDWCYQTGRRLDESDLFVWKHFVTKFGWNDEVTQRLTEIKQNAGLAERADIVTIPDLLDLDEQRIT